MSFIRRKFIHGNWYLYKVRSERHDNKVKQIYEEYLGPLEPKKIEDDVYKEYLMRRKLVVPNISKK